MRRDRVNACLPSQICIIPKLSSPFIKLAAAPIQTSSARRYNVSSCSANKEIFFTHIINNFLQRIKYHQDEYRAPALENLLTTALNFNAKMVVMVMKPRVE
jgi:hypothetical protein